MIDTTENSNSKPVSRQRKWQLERIALGLCVTCGEKSRLGKRMCQKCADKANERNKEWHKENPGYMHDYLCKYRADHRKEPGRK